MSREENNDLFILQLPADLNFIENNYNSNIGDSNSNNNNNNIGDNNNGNRVEYNDDSGHDQNKSSHSMMMMMKSENNRIGKIQLMKSGQYFLYFYF